ncbi:hypothetical protein [Pelovirga terrestris]|uniref:Uncharacterized protein n=1 Tax=Pelovirga terrestris TaxID=2771352 RepID=A0A8J6UHE4_9BACT|nr:hypothetical protein [Pelovirga terrestris]MBD1401323.1 hypothetical protein [Pelovirga terrestris]
MQRRERIKHAKRVLSGLQELEANWLGGSNDQHQEAQRRERLKILEAELAVMRFLQSERRLMQQIWIAIPSVMGGSLVTLFIQRFLGYLSSTY